MRRTHRTAFPALFSTFEKQTLVGLAEAHGMTMCAVLRQLILREAASRALIHPTHGTPHQQTVIGGDR